MIIHGGNNYLGPMNLANNAEKNKNSPMRVITKSGSTKKYAN